MGQSVSGSITTLDFYALMYQTWQARRSVKWITCPVIGSKVEAPAIYVFYQQPLFASDNDKSAKLAGGRQSWHGRVSMLKSGERLVLGAVVVSVPPYKFQRNALKF